MDNEVYRDLGHDEAADLLQHFYLKRGYRPHREFVLTNGRRADLFIMARNRDFNIVEVKTEFKTSFLELTFLKYNTEAHCLWLAVPGLQSSRLDNQFSSLQWKTERDGVGVIAVHRDRIQLLRQPARRAMTGAKYEQLHAMLKGR
jgi:hypothetical protein